MEESNYKTGYAICGAPFFKDALGHPAPVNDDYRFRKNVAKEFFPFDLPPTTSRWKTREKVALITGVKQQMVDHIKSQQSRRLCTERKTRTTFQKMKYISHNQDLIQSPIIDVYHTIQNDYPDFAINWNLISFSDLHSNHSVSECMGMWFSYLCPDLNREPFSEEENQILEAILVQNSIRSWDEVANQLDRRSPLQTFVHVQSVFSRLCSNVRWTQEEDDKLLCAMDQYSVNGIINWGKVGQVIPQRSKTQCYNRYQTIKCPAAKKGVFTKQENRAIMEYVEGYGDNAFKNMPNNFLPGRSIIQIRNHYRIALKHNGTILPWTKEEDAKLMAYVEERGTNDWSAIAQSLQTHNRISCRTRYLTITNFLKKNPGLTVADVPTRLKRVTAAQKAKEPSDPEEKEDPESVAAILKFKSQQADLYNLFRQSFNFDFSAREMKIDNVKLLVLMWMFRVQKYIIPDRRIHQFTVGQIAKLRENMKFKIEEEIVDEMKFIRKHTQFLMPPNYNTIVGLRYITIKKNEEPLDENIVSVADPSKRHSEALLDFQKLYFSLFYWSAMLTKMKTNDICRTHFVKDQSSGETSISGFLAQFSGRELLASGALKRSSTRKSHSKAKKAKFE